MTKVNDGFYDILTQITSNLESLGSFRRGCQTDIRQFRHELNTFLDELETAALNETETCELLEKETIKRHESSCLATKHILVNDLNLADQVEQGSDDADIFATEVKLSARLKEYKIVLHDICQETELPYITFERNDQLTELLQKIKELGKLKVEVRNMDKK